MGEKKIIESVSTYKKKVLQATIIFAILAIVALIAIVSVQMPIDKNGNIVYSNLHGSYNSDEIESARQKLHTLYNVEEIGIFGLVICAPISLILFVFYLYVNKMQIVVTDKRVYGKTSFGKQVDLPLDSISAVGTSVFKGIAVGTSSGKIKFLGISNRDEVYEEIKKILADRQEKEIKVKSTAPVTNITQEQSSADELKKFKDLLDSGIITQEEFDAKKKQLLGL